MSLPVSVADVIRIALLAGQAINRIYQQKSSSVTFKEDNSPLTEADLAAHQVVVNGLHQLAPLIPIVSEEDDNSWGYRTPLGEFWLLDPLDGTREFLAHNGEFTVNIALIRAGVTVFGVVHAPVLGQTYWGGIGIGAFKDLGAGPVPIHVAEKTGLGEPLRIVASKSHLNEETLRFIEKLSPYQLVQAGSSLKFCRIAEGAADVYPRLGPTSEWDTAAAQAIVEAAGGNVSDLDGTPLRYGKPEVLNPSFVASSCSLGPEGSLL
ncbi:MAG: 3'(2'),5'-bisphosphate nucleotidase CysQ [Ferrovum sp.]|nr:3'(2'),5'-bisphosphate nucleotidase CysQ [Ferrovum sp.]